jgi:alpha-tubulin suppressor-like RCC1 family protein
MKAKESLNTEKLFKKIAMAGTNSLRGTNAIDQKGKLWAWGSNVVSAFGNKNISSQTAAASPVKTLGYGKIFNEISSGGSSVIALDDSGTAWVWGTGIIGDGLNAGTFRRTPVKVYGDKTFCQVSGGSGFCGGIDKYGQIWMWGDNYYGQLGDNSNVCKSTPTAIYGGPKTFCQISIGFVNSYALDKYGKAWAWGSNPLGDGSNVSRITPVNVYGNKTFCQISVLYDKSLAIDKNGKAWAWGSYYLGNGSASSSLTPVEVYGNTTFCKIAKGVAFSTVALIDKNGQVWGWGNNTWGTLGDSHQLVSTLTPVSISGQKKTFCEISMCWENVIAIEKNGRVWGWGRNRVGELGVNRFYEDFIPRKICGEKTFNSIAVGPTTSAGIQQNGKVFLWGNNGNAQIGNNKISNYEMFPTELAGQPKTFCQIAFGANRTQAIDKNGKVWGWGNEASGALGNNYSGGATISYKLTPIQIYGTNTFCKIMVGFGGSFTFAIDNQNKIWGWGANNSSFRYLTLDASIASVTTPVSLPYLNSKTFCQISAGFQHNLALDNYGKIWAWGLNSWGQIGNNDFGQNVTSPVTVYGSTTFCKISAGGNMSAAIDKDKNLWTWGYNRFRNSLGHTNWTATRTPIRVSANIKFNELSAGKIQGLGICAIDENGLVWRMTSAPIAVNSEKRFCKIDSGGQHFIVTDENNVGWSFGLGEYGALGNYNTYTPVRLYNI